MAARVLMPRSAGSTTQSAPPRLTEPTPTNGGKTRPVAQAAEGASLRDVLRNCGRVGGMGNVWVSSDVALRQVAGRGATNAAAEA
jgi:hypothetical protein